MIENRSKTRITARRLTHNGRYGITNQWIVHKAIGEEGVGRSPRCDVVRL